MEGRSKVNKTLFIRSEEIEKCNGHVVQSGRALPYRIAGRNCHYRHPGAAMPCSPLIRLESGAGRRCV